MGGLTGSSSWVMRPSPRSAKGGGGGGEDSGGSNLWEEEVGVVVAAARSWEGRQIWLPTSTISRLSSYGNFY